MNEQKKMIYVLVGLVAVVLLFIGVGIVQTYRGEEIYNKVVETLAKKENNLIYVGRPTCSYCAMLEPNLKDFKDRYKFDYVYANIDEMGSVYLKKLMKVLELESLSTPYLAVVNDNKTVAKQNGFVDYNKLFDFLQKNTFIAADQKPLINYITYNQYEELLKSEQKQVIVIGQSTCSYCVLAKIALGDVVTENNIVVNYISLSDLSSDEQKKLKESLPYLKENNFGTPLMLVVEKGSLVKNLNGYNTPENYTKFLKEQGVI